MASKKSPLSDKASEALKRFEETTNFHRNFVDAARIRYRAYRGILDSDSEAADWQSKLHPPFVRHHVETMVSGLNVGKLGFKIRPKPRLYDSPDERELARRGAEAHEILHHNQLAADRFSVKLRPFILQAAVCNFSVAKTFWRTDTVRKKRLQAVDVGEQQYGFPTGIFDLVEVEENVEQYVGPCTEVVNIEDFFWHEAATEIQRSPIVAHRVWMHINELYEAQAAGRFSNVSELSESLRQSGHGRIYEASDTRDPTRDMVEVLEIWYREKNGIHVVTLGNRSVELRSPRPNPFWHGEYPFVTFSLEPDLFQIPGSGPVEKIAHLQESAWDLLNQTHDNIRLQNNFIIGINTSAIEDPDSLEWGPGERWPVEQGSINDAIQVFKPDFNVSGIAFPMLSAIQRDMQTLAGSQPFTSTSEAGRMGADTATEAALLSNIAQQSTKAMQEQVLMAVERIGQQRTELNQQFIRTPMVVEQIGLDSALEQQEILPQILQGNYRFDITPTSESLMRSERRAEANALIQTWLQIMQVWVPLAAAGAASPPNGDAFLERWLEGFDEDPRRFFSARPQPQMQIGGGGGPPQPGQMPQNGGGMGIGGNGITSPLAAGPMTPSGQTSVSPESMLQRMFAQQGGIANT